MFHGLNREIVGRPVGATGNERNRMTQSTGDDWGRADVGAARRWFRRALRPVEDRYGVVMGRRHQRAAREGWADRSLGAEVVRAAAATAPESDATTAPIFVLAATWRSGSTLLQRLLLSSGDVMMWGEPWNRCDLVPRLRESLRPLDDAWPAPGNVVDELEAGDRLDDAALHELMVPDLYPERTDLLAAHRALFDRLLAEPAARRGYRRWGLKETRLSADDARYLHALYPEARIVFVHRDPYASWSSYVALRAQGYTRWPDEPIVSPRDFGRLWADRVAGYLAYPDDLPHMVVSYESLVDDPAVLAALGEFCGVVPDSTTLERKVGRSHGARLPAASAARVEKAVGSLAVDLGYLRPS